MSEIEPKSLFRLIAAHVPLDLRPNLLMVGSLAAGYHHRSVLTNNMVKTRTPTSSSHRQPQWTSAGRSRSACWATGGGRSPTAIRCPAPIRRTGFGPSGSWLQSFADLMATPVASTR
jgi:hypothetical protein